jgi:YrbI family 3-deoxy-D-manno-octulosonate 8-phosphate phosphatase
LTDGSIFVDGKGRESKQFFVRDGFAIKCWQRAGGRLAVISGRSAAAVAHRCKELGIDDVVQGAIDKLPAFTALLAKQQMEAAEACAIGDDLPDLPLLTASGIGVAVADAAPEVIERADWVTRAAGGRGAVRELIQELLTAQGSWDATVAHYCRPTS